MRQIRLALLVLAFLFLSPVWTDRLLAQEEVSFITRRDYGGLYSSTLIVADFNGDKILDVALNGWTVLLGNGDGTFIPISAIGPAGSLPGPQWLAAGDFNNDEILDLVQSNGWVMLGNGDGTFRLGERFETTRSPRSVAVGDFNGDKILDLAVANGTDRVDPRRNTVSILLGNGDGTFQRPQYIPLGTGPWSIVAADFNGDELLDLAVARFVVGRTESSTVCVLLGNGDGTFRPPQEVGVTGIFVTVADLDGDEIPDLVVAGDDVPQPVYVLLGNGDGSFRRATYLGFYGGSAAVGDFNGDKIQDLAVAVANRGSAYGETDAVYVLLGRGDGTFGPAQAFGVGGIPRPVAVGDFNGDGVPDLVTANSLINTVSVLLGNGDGTFLSAPIYRVGYRPHSVVVGDFNGDAIPDLATANESEGRYGWGTVSVLLGNADGSFRAAQSFQAGRQPRSLRVGDFNGDKIPDLVVANSINANERDRPTNTVSVLLGNGDGTYGPFQSYQVARNPDSVDIGDFNGDDIPDLVAGGNPVYLLLGNGDGTFQTARSLDIFGASVTVADFNGDGIADLALSVTTAESLYVLLGNGDGTFQARRGALFNQGIIRSIAVGDINGDKIPDIAASNGTKVFVLLGHGDGTFEPAREVEAGAAPGFVALVDFNGDGITDLAVTNGQTAHISVLLGDGDGTFRFGGEFAVGSYPNAIAVGDFNGDGRLDMAVSNWFSNNVSMLINAPPP